MNSPETKPQFPDLLQDIRDLKKIGEPLGQEVVISPIMPFITQIIGLPEESELSEMSIRELHKTQNDVAELKRVLDELSYEYIQKIITKPTPSKVFRILGSSNAFQRELKKALGKEFEMSNGEKIILTPEITECLTRYRFSIGTPPVTPEGIKTLEEIIFGGELKSIYAFRDLFGGNRVVFDRFVSNLGRLIQQSTRYTTAGDKKEFEKEASDFPNLEGLRGFTKTTITGSAESAIRLISDRLFSQHTNGSRPIKVEEERDCLDDNLIKRMVDQPERMFVVRVSSVPHNIFTSDVVYEKWRGVICRLILVDDSENARRSGSTFVYSFAPDITETLHTLHVKDSGTPANTQMNLRRILEKTRGTDLNTLMAEVDKKMAEYEEEGDFNHSIDYSRKREWIMTAQKDYLSLQRFREFLGFIKEQKSGDKKDLQKKDKELNTDIERQTMKYFFSALNGKGYKCISVPQGGGRRELGLVGKYHLLKHEKALDEFKENNLKKYKEKLTALKEQQGISADGSDAENAAYRRAVRGMQSPNHEVRVRTENTSAGPLIDLILEKAQSILYSGAQKAEATIGEIESLVDQLASANLSGEVRSQVSQKVFRRLGLKSASKQMERGGFRKAGNFVRKMQGLLKRGADQLSHKPQDTAREIIRNLNYNSLDVVQEMINNIEKGTFFPHLALSEVGWTFNDVLDEDDFPPKNYIKIELDENGQMKPESLAAHLEALELDLREFPELFKLYCSSIILVINDPHNPTSSVASNKAKLQLLDIASEYEIAILSDEAYRKQVQSDIKEKQGDASLAEFYEQNRARFSKPITIYTSLPTTKWAIGAGRRTGALITNDISKITGKTEYDFESFIRGNIDSANSMSLYMDRETYRTGLMVKKICKELEPCITNPTLKPARVIDLILQEYFSDPKDKNFIPALYFALIQARNDLDRLNIRGGMGLVYRQYIDGFISDLKNYRLDKRTQRDSAQRAKAANNALKRVMADHPELDGRSIKPQGPFYFSIKLNDKEDSSMQQFLQAIAKARKIDVVPRSNGYIRFSLGGEVDGSAKGYELLSLAIETDLRLLIKYWNQFKEKRIELSQAGDLNPVSNGLKELFPGGEVDIARTLQDKKALIYALQEYQGESSKPLALTIPASAINYISQIEPDSKAHILTIQGIQCESAEDFVKSRPFQALFNYYLMEIKGQIPELQQLTDRDIRAYYGAREFSKKFPHGSRNFRDSEKELFGKIAFQIAKKWYSQNTIKIFAEKIAEGTNNRNGRSIMGTEKILNSYIDAFLKAFLPEELEAQLAKRPTFQAGYESIPGVGADKNLPLYAQTFIKHADFSGQTMPTDESPEMVTGGLARVAGGDRGIFRRDGDGENAPTREYFNERLSRFAEVMNPKEYICKMVQVGGSQVLLIMNRSYSHYLVEELRLFPQVDISPEELKNVKPNAISFLGIPQKVIGEDYKIGYFLDEYYEGEQKVTMPVSWVDAENITDYMGYFKKPILTVANERVKALGGLPIHGSAFTIVYKDGLRKTIVLGGDSGTGKSETIIAMVEQIIEGAGDARDIEGIELIAGDMLSLYEGDDGQMYMLGTEQGDFMRMTDIPEDWQKRFRDLVEQGSKTNIDDKYNPRVTISGLCDQEKVLKPTRVNMFVHIDNFQQPERTSFEEIEDQRNLLLNTYIHGYRGEKGTSGDQPNILASVKFSKVKGKNEIARFGETLDDYLGWEVMVNDRGKAGNAILKFNDIQGKAPRALEMVEALFVGKQLQINDPKDSRLGEDAKKYPARITSVRYDVQENRFYITLRGKFLDKDKTFEMPLMRNEVFSQIYEPIASTYCGNPFIHPEGMDEVLSRFADVMKEAGVITGVLYTQLKVKGKQFSGPAAASHDVMKFINEDPRINRRFLKNKQIVTRGLKEKYGDQVFGQEDIPKEIRAFNLYLLERQQSDTIKFVDTRGTEGKKHIDIRTPLYQYREEAVMNGEGKRFEPSLITPEIKASIADICTDEEYDLENLDSFHIDLSRYEHIKAWDSKEELIFQILHTHGTIKLGYQTTQFERRHEEVKKSEKIAKKIIDRKGETRTSV